jgi:Effector-associated domain 1
MPITLTGPQVDALSDAVLKGFNKSDLEQLMLFDMDVHLDQVVGGGPLATVVFDLIVWVNAQGRVDEFLDAITKRRPRNVAIRQAVAALRAGA